VLDKSKLGNRYSCFACGTKFYDLNKSPATCPECSASQEDAPTRDKVREALGRGPSRKSNVAAEEEKTVEVPVVDESELETEDMEGMEGMHLVDESEQSDESDEAETQDDD